MELAPSFTITFSCSLLSQRKISSPCTSPRLSSEFCRTIQFYNSLVVCHYHDFSPKQLRSSEPFLIYLFSLCDSFIMSQTNQICGGLYFHFIKLQSYWQSCCCVQLAKQIAQLSGFQKTSQTVMISDTKFINRVLIDTSVEQRFKLI